MKKHCSTPGQKLCMHLQGSGGCMQTGNQKLNTFADVWTNGLDTYSLAGVQVFLWVGLSTFFFRWILYMYVSHVCTHSCIYSMYIFTCTCRS